MNENYEQNKLKVKNYKIGEGTNYEINIIIHHIFCTFQNFHLL